MTWNMQGFTPLVISVNGGMGKVATTFYKKLSSMISEKRNTEFSQSVNWIRCKLSFALLRASIISIRGARSSRHHAVSETTQKPFKLQLVEGQIHYICCYCTLYFKINFCFYCKEILYIYIYIYIRTTNFAITLPFTLDFKLPAS